MVKYNKAKKKMMKVKSSPIKQQIKRQAILQKEVKNIMGIRCI